MKSALLTSVIGVLVCLLLANPGVRAQGVGSSASISGTVTDPTGATVPNAEILAVETDKGIQYTATTDGNGQYRLTGLPPATYDVTVRHAGFNSEVQKNVVLNVGQTVFVDFHLQIATGTQTVEVLAELPVVETERGSQSDTLTQGDIAGLPIGRRDYLTFTLLMPGVSDATRLADDQDFRVKQTPQSGLSFYGSNGRGNSITVDGGEANVDSGGVRLTLGLDTVQEFQVNRSNYGADLGGASGASINIVAKSGTNDLHGGLFSYFRNDAMDARDPFAFSQALQPGQAFDPTAADTTGRPIKNSLSRYQYGGTLGLPIRRDKTFFFGGFEGLLQNAQNAVPLLTNTSTLRPDATQQPILGGLVTLGQGANPDVPCLSGPIGAAVAASLGLPAPNPTTNVPAGTCAAILNGTLTLNPAANPFSGFLVNQFESNGGVFNYNTREYLASGRLDHRFSENNQLYFSYRYARDREENPDVQSLTGFSAGSSIHNYDNNVQAGWFHQFSGKAQNEFRAQWNYNGFNVIPNEPGEVGLQIFGFINNLGTNIFLPSFTISRRAEIADNLTLTRGHHTLKFGGSELLRGNHTESHTFFPGRFVFGALPGNLLSPCLTTPIACQLPSVNSALLNSLQSANFGVPQVFQQGFGNADYPAYTRPFTAGYLQDSWRMAANFTLTYGLRYELDSQFLPLNNYYRDFGPRLSFAWDPFKNHKTVIRGGYGIFYGPIDAQIPQVDLSLGVLNKNHSTVENQNNKSQVPDQVNNVIGTCGVSFGPVQIVPPSPPASSPCTRYIAIYVDPIGQTPFFPTLQTAPQVFQGLFGQGLIQCTTPTAGNAACVTAADVAQFGIFVANSGPLSPLTVLFSNPPNFKPPYSQQASIGIEREIVPGFSISLSGIYSHTLRLPVAIDTNLMQAPLTAATLANGKTVQYRNWNGGVAPGNAAPADPLGGQEVIVSGPNAGQPVLTAGYPCADPFACFVNPLIIQNNQYTSAASALYEGGILEIKKRFSNSFTLLGNYTFSKGFDTSTDFNSDYGPQDPTNLGLDRGLSEFDERHKVVIAGVFDSPWKGGIIGGFQLAPIFSYHSGHPFNLLAGGEVNGNNHTTNQRPIGAPRDTGLGPDYVNFDMRMSWQHKVAEKARVQITAEGFNIANRTNFASVNNEVGPAFGFVPGFTTFNVHGSKLLSPSQPLGFTSAFPKREVQLGLRLTF